jgi:hypothetical protein
MVLNIGALLLLLACICFVLSAVGVNSPRLNLTATGLALLALAMLVAAVGVTR